MSTTATATADMLHAVSPSITSSNDNSTCDSPTTSIDAFYSSYGSAASNPMTKTSDRIAECLSIFNSEATPAHRKHILVQLIGACTVREIRFVQLCVSQRTATRLISPIQLPANRSFSHTANPLSQEHPKETSTHTVSPTMMHLATAHTSKTLNATRLPASTCTLVPPTLHSKHNKLLHQPLSTSILTTHLQSISPWQPSLISLDSFQDLADELIVHILSYVHSTATLSECARANRRFHLIMADNSLWRQICTMRKLTPVRASPTKPTTPGGSGGGHGHGHGRHREISTPTLGMNRPARHHSMHIPLGSSPECRWPSLPALLRESLAPAPWKKVYMDNHLTWTNWMKGRFQLTSVHPSASTGRLCLNFDDQQAVSVKVGEPAQLWDIQTGQPKMVLGGHEGMISAVKFDRRMIVSGGSDATVRIWNAETGACLHTLIGHLGEVTCVQHDADIVISGSEDHTARIWRISDGRCDQTLRGHSGAVCCLQFRNNTLVTGSTDTTLCVWDINTGRCVRTLSGHTSHVFCVQFDDRYICSGSNDTNIKIWDVSTGHLVRTLTGHHLGVVCLQFDQTKIVSGSADKTIKVWNIKTGHTMYTLKQHTGSIWNLYFTKTQLISSSLDETLLIWDFACEEPLTNTACKISYEDNEDTRGDEMWDE
ncbi:hypothetical protein BASA50_005450 [Batrachochytrium salamandrivorans]|uniref:F-box domain-containing protein n=1 Tax=Batrachochytrium salamandrivorans TaxID=1357716 RepID=A0ABQ8FCM5_9FUNG|nr:hypothetical protein BASA50_005450 [Batrachochytrium salamandrivorans]